MVNKLSGGESFNSRKDKFKNQPWISNKAERNRVFVALGVAFLIILFGCWYYPYAFSQSFDTRAFKGFFKEYGSYARLAFFFVLAHYVLMVILRRNILKNFGKQLAIKLSRIARQWHTPVAIIAIALVVLHVIGAFLYGFRWDFHYISGLLALLVLLPTPISGLLRYRKLDRKWHWTSGISFAVLFLIHAYL
jgi:cytochrome b561